jgi:hypothetical protein
MRRLFLRELKEANKALQAKRDEWSIKLSFPLEKTDPEYIAALITGLETLGNHLSTYLPRAKQLRDKGYSRADGLLSSLFFTLMAFESNLHQWYRKTLSQQTKDEVEKVRDKVHKRGQDIQNDISKRWRADFFRTCIHCQRWLGDDYSFFQTCPNCGRFLHK